MFVCYIGYWEDKLSLSPHPDDEYMFRGFGSLGILTEGRTMAVMPDPGGNNPSELDRVRHAGLGLVYIWRLRGLPWARFKRHGVEVDLDEDGSFMWEVSSDHILPWPRFAHTKDFDVHAVAQREMLVRGRSAYEEGGEVGLRRTLRGVPDEVRSLLPAATWRSTVETILRGEQTCTS